MKIRCPERPEIPFDDLDNLTGIIILHKTIVEMADNTQNLGQSGQIKNLEQYLTTPLPALRAHLSY